MAARVIKRFVRPNTRPPSSFSPLLDSSSRRFVSAGTSSTPRRRPLWWNTTSSWRPIWQTESSCLTAFPPSRPWPTRKSPEKRLAASPDRCCHDNSYTSLLFAQTSESAGRDEPLPGTARNHLQKRSKQLQTTYQQAQFHQGTNIFSECYTGKYKNRLSASSLCLFQDTEQKKSGNYFFLEE